MIPIWFWISYSAFFNFLAKSHFCYSLPYFYTFHPNKKPYKINRIKHKMRNFLRILDHIQHRFHPISSQKNRDRYCVSKWWQCTIDIMLMGYFVFNFRNYFSHKKEKNNVLQIIRAIKVGQISNNNKAGEILTSCHQQYDYQQNNCQISQL